MRHTAFVILLSCMMLAAIVGDMELILVQVIWRHGDRSPTKTFRTDPFQEWNWTFGGGGFAQLSPVGMKQHMDFGRLLRKVYIDNLGFLSRRFSSKEIYIRSTDRNRTIVSAIANLIGMYGQNGSNVAGTDYPGVDGWPSGFVPIPVHTSDPKLDYIGNPDTDCPRQKTLWQMAKNSPEVRAFRNKQEVSSLLDDLTMKCGETIDLDKLSTVRDALFIERIHANETLRSVNKWFNDSLLDQLTNINNQVQLYKNGVFGKTMTINNLDVGLELQKIRGGMMINFIASQMDAKVECLNKFTSNCKWMNGLKFYAYSAHDSTIFVFLSILGIQNTVLVPPGYPEYTAATIVELWVNRSNNAPYFKLLYHRNEASEALEDITQAVGQCHGKEFCNLDVLRQIASRFKPDQPMEQVAPFSAAYADLRLVPHVTIGDDFMQPLCCQTSG